MILIECLGELLAIFLLLDIVLFQYLGQVNLDLLPLFFKLVHGQFVWLLESQLVFLTHLDGFNSKLLTLGLYTVYLLLQVFEVDISYFFVLGAVFFVPIVAIFFGFVWFFKLLNLSL